MKIILPILALVLGAMIAGAVLPSGGLDLRRVAAEPAESAKTAAKPASEPADGWNGTEPASLPTPAHSQQSQSANSTPPTPPVSLLASSNEKMLAAVALPILERAREELQRRESMSARVRYQINLFEQQLIGSGGYWQSGRGSDKRVRFELRVQRSEDYSHWLQVCDGRYVWTAAETLNGPLLTRLDLNRIRKQQELQWGYTTFSDGVLWDWGGLPKMLKVLEQNFTWSRAVSGVLEPDKTPAWALTGEWKPKNLAALVPEQAARIAAAPTPTFELFPPQIPARITLYIRQQDFFVQRIEYRSPQGVRGGAELPPEQWPVALTLEFTDVVFDQRLDEQIFAYQPGRQEVLDVTDNVLLSLLLKP